MNAKPKKKLSKPMFAIVVIVGLVAGMGLNGYMKQQHSNDPTPPDVRLQLGFTQLQIDQMDGKVPTPQATSSQPVGMENQKQVAEPPQAALEPTYTAGNSPVDQDYRARQAANATGKYNEYLTPTQFRYTGTDSTSPCTGDTGKPIDCDAIKGVIPMLQPQDVAKHYCDGGFCMKLGDCEVIVGRDPLFYNPARYGIEDWGAYYQANYHTRLDPAVCE